MLLLVSKIVQRSCVVLWGGGDCALQLCACRLRLDQMYVVWRQPASWSCFSRSCLLFYNVAVACCMITSFLHLDCAEIHRRLSLCGADYAPCVCVCGCFPVCAPLLQVSIDSMFCVRNFKTVLPEGPCSGIHVSGCAAHLDTLFGFKHRRSVCKPCLSDLWS